MSLKYRVRLKNERIVGPFSKDEIGELFSKGHITGTEMCQQFPIGEWQAISSFGEFTSYLTKQREEAEVPPVVEAKENLAEVPPVKTPEKTHASVSFNEFKFDRIAKDIDVDYAELEKKYKAENRPEVTESNIDLDKTVVIRKNKAPPIQELEKTVVVARPEFTKPAPVEEEAQKPAPPPIVEIREPEPEIDPRELANEKTEFINLARALPQINAQLSASEVELDKQAKIDENKEKKRLRQLKEVVLKEQAIEDGYAEEEIEVIEEYSKEKKDFEQRIVFTKKKKGMSIVAILAFLGVFYFFMDDKPAPIPAGPLYLEVKFPIIAPTENTQVASEKLAEARKLYGMGAYRSRAISTGHYLLSLQNKFTGNESLGEIIVAYSELLENVREKYQASNVLYKYIQTADSRLLTDHMVATGVALFYNRVGKHQTGIYIIKNYLRAGNRPTPKMLTYYLRLLISAGELVEARKVYENLSKIPQKPFETYVEMASFDLLNDDYANAKSIILDGLKYYSESAALLLVYADILLKEQSVQAYEEVLSKVDAIQAESSPVYLAKFYKHMGYLSAFKNMNEKAAEFFKRSLNLQESDELRTTLARLEIGGNQIAQDLILESKVLGLMKNARQEFDRKNYDTAFQFIIAAVDAAPDYVPAVLLQAEMNTYRGFFESAIFAVERLIANNPQNNDLRKTLAQIYIKSFKFAETERILSELGQSTYTNTPEFADLMGEFFEAKRNFPNALRWYGRALQRDPLNDAVMFKMAKILVLGKKFNDGRSILSRALHLNPLNFQYHALYAEVLYEQDGTDTAIGYLRDLIKEHGEIPVLVSSITTFYFKSGQLKEFNAYYEKVQKMPKKDEALYEVLIRAALLEGRKEEYVTHSKSLLKLNPGNLKVRMNLGELFFNEKRYAEALLEFNEVQSMLASYPLVHYYLARVYLAQGNVDKAYEMASKELELNPNLEAAHYIMGEVYRTQQNFREAILYFEKAISLNPKAVEPLLAMATIRLAQNYTTEALELLKRALREDVSNPLVHKLMGDAYRAAGQRALAREKYEDYLKLTPGASDKSLIESLIRNLQ